MAGNLKVFGHFFEVMPYFIAHPDPCPLLFYLP